MEDTAIDSGKHVFNYRTPGAIGRVKAKGLHLEPFMFVFG